MKIRRGFVSNSSSSSFLVVIKNEDTIRTVEDVEKIFFKDLTHLKALYGSTEIIDVNKASEVLFKQIEDPIDVVRPASLFGFFEAFARDEHETAEAEAGRFLRHGNFYKGEDYTYDEEEAIEARIRLRAFELYDNFTKKYVPILTDHRQKTERSKYQSYFFNFDDGKEDEAILEQGAGFTDVVKCFHLSQH